MNSMSSPLDDDALVARLRGLGSTGGSSSTSWTPAGARTMDGAVVLDSFAGGMDAIRSIADLQTRQLVVEAGDLTAVLDLAAQGDGNWLVSGQVMGATSATVVQFAAHDGTELAITYADLDGEFEVIVPGGDHLLFLATDEVDVNVPVNVN
jgi:hypothetical protein